VTSVFGCAILLAPWQRVETLVLLKEWIGCLRPTVVPTKALTILTTELVAAKTARSATSIALILFKLDPVAPGLLLDLIEKTTHRLS